MKIRFLIPLISLSFLGQLAAQSIDAGRNLRIKFSSGFAVGDSIVLSGMNAHCLNGKESEITVSKRGIADLSVRFHRQSLLIPAKLIHCASELRFVPQNGRNQDVGIVAILTLLPDKTLLRISNKPSYYVISIEGREEGYEPLETKLMFEGTAFEPPTRIRIGHTNIDNLNWKYDGSTEVTGSLNKQPARKREWLLGRNENESYRFRVLLLPGYRFVEVVVNNGRQYFEVSVYFSKAPFR